METVLVTGGCGLIGRHIVSGLLKKGFAVISLDKEENGYNDGKENYRFVQASITVSCLKRIRSIFWFMQLVQLTMTSARS